MTRRTGIDRDAARLGAIVRRLRESKGWTFVQFGRNRGSRVRALVGGDEAADALLRECVAVTLVDRQQRTGDALPRGVAGTNDGRLDREWSPRVEHAQRVARVGAEDVRVDGRGVGAAGDELQRSKMRARGEDPAEELRGRMRGDAVPHREPAALRV